MLPIRHRGLKLAGFALSVFVAGAPPGSSAHAQNAGEPGRFDFYLMNVAAPADFCHVPGAGPACRPPRSFVLHGLWTQNNNGTYPVNCAAQRGPARLERFLDLTPDLPLLQHEWDKHGTCAAVGPERFFAMERKAYGLLYLPADLKVPTQARTLETAEVLRDLQRINPGFPPGSILLSCKEGKLTAVEACFTKDLKPMRCQGLHSCESTDLQVQPGSTPLR
jgi:ribonuclease T2